MDLSNLSSTLPPTKSLELVSLRALNSELTDEFKNAAKSVATLYNASSTNGTEQKAVKTEFAQAAKAVASLYRLGTNSSVLLMHKGYLECLDDFLSVIANGEDIENWALTKRAELTNYYSHKDTKEVGNEAGLNGLNDVKDAKSDIVPAQAETLTSEADFVLPREGEFAFPPELLAPMSFRPSFTPLSVTYKRSRSHIDVRNRKLAGSLHISETTSALSEAESESSDSSSDVELRRKRRVFKTQQDVSKRRKRDKSCAD